MATCPNGHISQTTDYCDVCGAPMPSPGAPSAPAGAAGSAAAAAPAGPGGRSGAAGGPPTPSGTPDAASPDQPAVCPRCGSPRTGRFCETDGYDFLTAALNPAAEQISAHAEQSRAQHPDPGGPASSTPSRSARTAAPSGTGWLVVVGADRHYFDVIRGMGGEDADALQFPAFAPERRFPLTGAQLTIGRNSRSRGIYPDIDLTGPPQDPGVSHLHALLVAQPDGGWSVVDLDSANGTYVNDAGGAPIESQRPVPLSDGNCIYLGAWTVLTVRRG